MIIKKIRHIKVHDEKNRDFNLVTGHTHFTKLFMRDCTMTAINFRE